ncbi:5'/3'-nucleotidase SurE [Alicyclobacillaceae bacterium I2511]|nr:5'/3'-nucleotidase SurE [Alicyclobacillaceae bacterium I2511]
MHILITNDDGYVATGLQMLKKVLQMHGHHVTFVAPENNCSGQSHSITLGPLRVRRIHVAGADGYVVWGTPADCVRVACSDYLTETFDLLISGINDGFNLGTDTFVSGTVGAAREAAMRRLPSIALSANPGDQWDAIVQTVSRHLPDWIQEAMVSPGELLNINIPTNGGTHWAWSQLSSNPPQQRIDVRENSDTGEWLRFTYEVNPTDESLNTDRSMVNQGVISVTRLPLPGLQQSLKHRLESTKLPRLGAAGLS